MEDVLSNLPNIRDLSFLFNDIFLNNIDMDNLTFCFNDQLTNLTLYLNKNEITHSGVEVLTSSIKKLGNMK